MALLCAASAKATEAISGPRTVGFVSGLFSEDGFMPHGHCYLWTKSLALLHVSSDGFIVASYFAIPGILIYFVRKRKDLPFGWMFVCFAIFIVACGTTNLLEIWNIWSSNYWAAGAGKGVTALASVPTAFLLANLAAPALALPSRSDLEALNDSLEKEVVARGQAEAAVRELNEELESRVEQRTAQLHAANADLLRQIGQKQRAEEELRESQERLSLALEAAEIAHWELHFDSGRMSGSVQHDQIFGYEKIQPEWNYDHFRHLHPEDRESVQQRFAKCLETGADWDAEYRIIRQDGACRVVWARGKVSEATEGKPRRMLGVLADVTDRRRAEQTALRLAAIVDSSSDAILGHDLDGVISSWNAAAERIFGYSATEITGESVRRLIPPDLQAEEERVRERVKNGERVHQFETVRLRKDGTSIDVAITVSPIRDSTGHTVGASKIVREITDEKRIREALKEGEARFRQLADSMPDIVWGSRPDGFLDYYNRRWYEFTGQDEGVGGDSSWAPVLHPDDLGRCSEMWEHAVATGEPYKIEYRFRDHRTGNYRWHLGRALPVRNGGDEIVRWYGTGTDIHDLKTAQAELESIQHTLEERVQDRTTQLASANQELETFSYSVSHDLRAPLRAISGFSRILAEEHAGSLDAEGTRYLRTIQDGAQQMGHLVDDLLAFSRLGREALKIRELNSREMVDSALATLAPMREGRSLQLTVEELPAVRGDGTLLKQVWVNLISNALKYTRERSPAVITIGARREGNTDVFFVRDNGAGFDMKYADNLFGVFQRLHRAEDYEGTGVGLALVQRIVHRHGGRIWAEAEENVGATFSFTLAEVSDV